METAEFYFGLMDVYQCFGGRGSTLVAKVVVAVSSASGWVALGGEGKPDEMRVIFLNLLFSLILCSFLKVRDKGFFKALFGLKKIR